jgi:hypothetical protein
MTESLEADVDMKSAEPRILQHASAQEVALSITADRHHDTGRVDAVAGSEFLDDRIRLLE